MIRDRRRAPAGRTYDPCPGCKKPPEGQSTHPKGDVCPACRIRLDAGTEHANAQAKDAEREAYLMPWHMPGFYEGEYEHFKKLPDGVAELLPGAGIHHAGDWIRYLLPALALELGEEVVGTADSIGRHSHYTRAARKAAGTVFKVKKSDRDSGSRQLILLKPRVRALLRDLDRAIRLALAETRAVSLKKGSNLLFQLSTGEITADALDDEVARDVQHRQKQAEDVAADNDRKKWEGD